MFFFGYGVVWHKKLFTEKEKLSTTKTSKMAVRCTDRNLYKTVLNIIYTRKERIVSMEVTEAEIIEKYFFYLQATTDTSFN